MTTGIDVSRHQGSVDFAAVRRAGHDFAILKATEGTSYSYVSWFHTHFPKAKAAGLVPGAYHFLRTGDGAAQARYFVSEVNKAGGFSGALAVVDVETAANGTKPMIGDVREFAAEFKRLVPGKILIIYTGRWYWVGHMGNPKGSDIGPLWHSEYETTQAEINDGPESANYGGWSGRPAIWQYTSTGHSPGVAGNCDLNIAYASLATLAGSGSTPPTKETLMALTDAQQEELYTVVRRLGYGLLPFYRDSQAGDPRFHAEALLERGLLSQGRLELISAAGVIGAAASVADAVVAKVQALLADLDINVDEAALAQAVTAAVGPEVAAAVTSELARKLSA